jgi:hypothetical protein
MSTTAIAGFMEVMTANGSVIRQWQNYWFEQTVEGYGHLPFNLSEAFSSSSSGQQSATVTLPISESVLTAVEDALRLAHLFRLMLYQVDASSAADPSARQLITEFIGEVISAEVEVASVTVSIGSSLDPLGAQVPPRKFTNTLVGTPYQP